MAHVQAVPHRLGDDQRHAERRERHGENQHDQAVDESCRGKREQPDIQHVDKRTEQQGDGYLHEDLDVRISHHAKLGDHEHAVHRKRRRAEAQALDGVHHVRHCADGRNTKPRARIHYNAAAQE